MPLGCVVLFLFSAVSWRVAYAIFRSPLSAFLSVAICWIACYADRPLMLFLTNTTGISNNKLITLAIIAIFVAAVAGFIVRKLKIGSLAGIYVLSMTSLLLLINVVPLMLGGAANNYVDASNAIKTDFTVETREEQPNVYWFHCDGMLGFSAMEKYFGDPQTDYANELNARGFEINRDAEFEAGHRTQKALPCLMSPYAYDTWISPFFTTHEAAIRSDLYSPLFQLRSNPELTNAFKEGGYHTVQQCQFIFMLPTAEINYDIMLQGSLINMQGSLFRINFVGENSEELALKWIESKNISYSLSQFSIYFRVLRDAIMQKHLDLEMESLSNPLSEDTKLSIGISENGADLIDPIANTLNDILMADNAPRFSILFYPSAHFPFILDENGNIVHESDNMRISDYPAQHIFTAKTLLNMVDMILEVDPDAVIVLQADHGLHGNTEEDFEEAFGTKDAALDMWNCVMSAIRVPEKYKNGDEHYALDTPLNISRYLVNNFVGKNYAYIGE